MMPSESLGSKRKPSRLGLPSVNLSRPETPQSAVSSSKRDRRNTTGLRNFFDKFRGYEPTFHMMTPPFSSPFTPPFPPQISNLAKAFADALNAQQLSNFLAWMLHHDVVALPESPEAWYLAIDSMEMRGWIVLGDFLSRTAETGHGLDLIVLDSICDHINISRKAVYEMLIHFAKPEKMAYSQIAIVFTEARAQNLSRLQTLEAVQAKLYELHKLASHLNPGEGSRYNAWCLVVQKRLRGFLNLVVGPRIKLLRSGTPLVTSEQTPKEIEDGAKLNYLFEVMQQERVVPLARYGTHSTAAVSYTSPQPLSPRKLFGDETERARSCTIQLMTENQGLRAQIASLGHDKTKLTQANDELAWKVTMLDRLEPTGYFTPADNVVQSYFPSCSASTSDGRISNSFQFSQARTRSQPDATGSQMSASSETTTRAHTRDAPENLSQKYEAVFSALDDTPPPAFRLTVPSASKQVDPFSSPCVASSPLLILNQYASQKASSTLGVSRRSGMVFSPSVRELVAKFGDGNVVGVGEPENEDDWVDEVVETPTPAARKR